MDASIAETLGQIPMFAFLDLEEREALAARVEVQTFSSGATLFEYGDPGDSMYVLQSGSVELSVKTKTGEKLHLETAEPGDFFGEISLLDQGPRTATAHALCNCSVLVVDRGDLDELFRMHPPAALDLLAATGRRMRQSALLLRNAASRNVNEELANPEKQSVALRAADWITAFSGSMPFLYIHIAIFFLWVILNVGLFPFGNFDPFPFGLLTMVVSLEAIILSVFVLLSQNRQASRDKVRNDVEYEINLKAESEIQHLHEKLDRMNAEVLQRLARIERRPAVSAADRTGENQAISSVR
jgi:CRP/FNR family transcriptional regulator, cyclic AMP receptor protein